MTLLFSRVMRMPLPLSMEKQCGGMMHCFSVYMVGGNTLWDRISGYIIQCQVIR